MPDFDIVIRGGSVIDGSGSPAFRADIGVRDGIIAALGDVSGTAGEEIDATGHIVTPGFVDVHTHYDGQVTWENRLSPSSDHGVTSVIMGNCAVGLAPCRPADHAMLMHVIAGVEDIPEAVMAEGLAWNWETFPEYMDVLEQRHADVDFAAQLAHAPLRVYVMGRRGARREPANTDDLRRMTEITREALEVGAIGVSTSRTASHRTPTGDLAPTETAAEEELLAIARGVCQAGTGVLEMVLDFNDVSLGVASEFDIIRRMAEVSRRPISFTVVEAPMQPTGWKTILKLVDKANEDGLAIKGQVAPRAVGINWGLDLSFNPFSFCASYQALAQLPLPERVAAMRDPETKERILSEVPIFDNEQLLWMMALTDRLFVMSDPPEYEPAPDQSLGAQAARLGVSSRSLAYDKLLELDGHSILYLPIANFGDGTLSAPLAMMRNPNTLLALGDGGAHYGLICDASYTTFALTHWCRDRKGERFELPWMVNAITHKAAQSTGLLDRGLIATGYKADINVIDYDRLSTRRPEVLYNLPSGGRRMVQRANGYTATLVSGVVTYRNGEATGALPGRLVRGARPAPRSVAHGVAAE